MNQDLLNAANKLNGEINHTSEILSLISENLNKGTCWTLGLNRLELEAILPALENHVASLRAQFAALREPS